MAEVKAKLNQLRIAPRKVRSVTNLVKGKNVNEALEQLEFMVKKSTKPVIKLLNSAVANAENNFNMVRDNLFIKSIIVNEGIKLRRFRAKGFGRGEAIQKKISSINLVLAEKVAGIRGEVKKVKSKEEQNQMQEYQNKSETVAESPEIKTEKKPKIQTKIGSKRNLLTNIGKRLFRRKAV